MIHFDNSRLHTESKENNRKRRKEAGHEMVQNDETEEDNDEIADDIDQTNADYYDRSPVAASTSENNDTNPVAKNFDTTSDSDESVTEDNNTISSDDESLDDDDYGYYNSKDKRQWIEEE